MFLWCPPNISRKGNIKLADKAKNKTENDWEANLFKKNELHMLWGSFNIIIGSKIYSVNPLRMAYKAAWVRLAR
jgi:hypothetical protein